MDKVLIVDPDRCTGCKVCEFICSLTHEKQVNPMKSRIQVISWETRGVDIPVVCQQCEDAPCEDVCPADAIHRDRETGALVIEEELCIGCRMCVTVCPFGAPTVKPDTREVVKCDLCGGDPQCVYFCSAKALQYLPASKGVLMKKRKAASHYSDQLKGRSTG